MKRYVVTVDMYVHARDEHHAISKAKMIANHQDQTYGNQCQVVKIEERPFASLTPKTIYER